MSPSPVLPLIVLRNQVLYPGEGAEIDCLRPATLQAFAQLRQGNEVVLVGQRDPGQEQPAAAELWPIGVVARVDRATKNEQGIGKLQVTATRRVRVEPVAASGTPVQASIDEVAAAEPATVADRRDAWTTAVRDLAPMLPPDAQATLGNPQADAAAFDRLLDQCARVAALSVAENQQLLQAHDLDARCRLLQPMVARKLRWQDEVGRFVIPDGRNLPQLWPLAPGGAERIERELQQGRITAAEATDLRCYAEHGYVIWERLIPEADVDALVADVRSIRNHPGCFLSTDHRRGFGFRFTDRDFDSYESIFDTYVNFDSARRISFHPRVLRFLELLFEAPPIAMQQLLFQRSNQHPLHQDTAYVRVQQPLHLAATWVALEDVVEGRGELVYYDGSHKIPHQLFGGTRKWFDLEHDDAAAAVRYVTDESARLGCKRSHFLARKGDVFLWAADLVHGSAQRTRPEHETRLSCVTHFVPMNAQPLYFLFSPDRRGLEPCGPRAFLASSHYELPRRQDGMLRPAFQGPLPT